MAWLFPPAAKARILFLEEQVSILQGRLALKDRRIIELEMALALYESPEATTLRLRQEEQRRARGTA